MWPKKVASAKRSKQYSDLLRHKAKYELDAVNYPDVYDAYAGLDADKLMDDRDTRIANQVTQKNGGV